MANQKEIQDKVIGFVSDYYGIPFEEISLDTSLLRDLGIDGDEAYDFFVAFRERFGVDLSSLDLDKSFNSEYCPIWKWPYAFYLGLESIFAPDKSYSRFNPIAIRDLVETVISGSWHNRKN